MMKEDVSFQQAGNAALRLLVHRPRSEFELSERLSKRFPKETVKKVLLWLNKRDLVDDTEFSKFWCKSRISSNPRSSWLLKKELIAKIKADTFTELTKLDNYKKTRKKVN